MIRRLLALVSATLGLVAAPAAANTVSGMPVAVESSARVPALLAVDIEMTTDPLFNIDHNDCAVGPRVAYVGFRITNPSTTTTLTGLRATLAGVTNGFSLTSNQNPEFYIGSLAPGASRYVYYLIQAPCIEGRIAYLRLTVANAADSRTQFETIRTTGARSSGAGGEVGSYVLGPGAIVGQTVYMDVTYTFGNVKAGDTYNIQPVGNLDFRAECLVLTSVEIISSGVPSIPVGARDQTYFVATQDQGGNTNPATARWYFKYMCAGVSTTANPYAASMSGGSMKYLGTFTGGSGGGPIVPPATNPFTGATTLSVTPTVRSTGGMVTYTLTVNNSSLYDATLDSLAVVLPAGVTFTALSPAGSVTAANSSEMPAAGSTGRIVFRGIPNSTYYIGANGSLALVFTANVSSTPRRYTATGFAYAGITALAAGEASVVVHADVITHMTGPDTALVGTTARYVVVTGNAGPAMATGVVPRLTLPAGMTFVAGSRGGTASGATVTLPTIANLGVNMQVVDTITVSVTTAGTKYFQSSSTATSSDSVAVNHNGSQAAARVTTEAIALSVSVRAVAVAPVDRMPGTGYSALYVVRNTSVRSMELALAGTMDAGASAVSATSLTGSGITAAGLNGSVTLPAGDSVIVSVTYDVAAGAGAVTDGIRLTATSTLVPTVTASALTSVRRAVPQMILVRSVDQSTVLPGQDVQYTIETQNVGGDPASAVVVTDSLGAPLDFKLGSHSELLLGGLTVTISYSTDGAGFTYTPTSGACGAPAGYDGCVRYIRWSITETVPVTTAVTRAGVFRYQARVR